MHFLGSSARSSRGTALTIAAVVAVSVAWLVSLQPPEQHASEESVSGTQVSGAYEALNHWSMSRAYPEADISSGGHSRGFEHSRRALQLPLRETFAYRDSGSTSALARGEGDGWIPIGPTNGGGRTLALAFDPDDSNILYVGAASGGLWRSATGGVGAAAWERVSTGFPVLGVSAITFDPSNSDVLYIGTGEVYNYQAAGDLEADRATRGSYGIGILKSTDRGVTWTKSLDWSYNQRHGVWAVRIDSTDSNVVWAATTEGVYKSVDAGQSWSLSLDVVMATDLVLHPLDPQVAIAGCGNLGSEGHGLYRTENGGTSWTRITDADVPDEYAGKVQFGVTPADPQIVFASIGNGFTVGDPDNFTWLLRSRDFGASWELRNTTDYSAWQGWFAHDVAVHPEDPDIVLAIGLDIWRSTNGGASLTRVSDNDDFFDGVLPPGGPEGGPEYSHTDHHDVLYHPTDPEIAYFANDGGVFRTVDGGATFEGANGGYQSQQFYNGFTSDLSDPDLAMGGLQDFSTAIYRGDGQWQRWVYSGDGGWTAIDPNDPDVVYATSQRLRFGRSINGGDSFFGSSPPRGNEPVAFIAPLVLSPTDPEFLVGASSFLFKSSDQGDIWTVGNGGVEIDGNPILVMAFAQQTDEVLYVASAPFEGRGRVHRSTDRGDSFVEITGTLPDRYPGDLAVDPTDEAIVYLTMSGFGSSHVFKSIDFGDTWIDLDNGLLPDVPTTAVVVDPLHPQHVYIGNDIGVYFTADDGANWVQLDAGLPSAVLIGDLSVSPANRKLRAATHGVGVFERDLLGLSLTVSGECLGTIEATVAGATPGANVLIAGSPVSGPAKVPSGTCAGTDIDLAEPSPLASIASDASGRITVSRNAPATVCGFVLQAVDATTCAVSNVARVPGE